MSEIDRWIEIAKECNYLPENDLKVRYTSEDPQPLYLSRCAATSVLGFKPSTEDHHHFGPWSLRSLVPSVLGPICTSTSVSSHFGFKDRSD